MATITARQFANGATTPTIPTHALPMAITARNGSPVEYLSVRGRGTAGDGVTPAGGAAVIGAAAIAADTAIGVDTVTEAAIEADTASMAMRVATTTGAAMADMAAMVGI